MECREVRALADAYLDDELLVETNHAVLAHLTNCVACAREIERLRTLRVTLKRAFDSDTTLAPRANFVASLRSGLESSVGNVGASTWLRYVPWMAVAAVLVLSVAVWRLGRGGPAAMADDPAMQPLIESAVGDHRGC